MPAWAEFCYGLVFREPCPPYARELITDHAADVINALKCTGVASSAASGAADGVSAGPARGR
ncbi:hypothetical protein GCM10020256_69790 [Streptomyces thermocoprophilus]